MMRGSGAFGRGGCGAGFGSAASFGVDFERSLILGSLFRFVRGSSGGLARGGAVTGMRAPVCSSVASLLPPCRDDKPTTPVAALARRVLPWPTRVMLAR